MLRALPFPYMHSGLRRLDVQASAVIHTLVYFSMFHHPLRMEELTKYLHFCSATHQDVQAAVQRLSRLGMVRSSQGFYHLEGQESLVDIRQRRNCLAEHWLPKIRKSVSVLKRIPFVE